VLGNDYRFPLGSSRIPSILTIPSFHTFGIRLNGPKLSSYKEI
jgi:hypothetical protein